MKVFIAVSLSMALTLLAACSSPSTSAPPQTPPESISTLDPPLETDPMLQNLTNYASGMIAGILREQRPVEDIKQLVDSIRQTPDLVRTRDNLGRTLLTGTIAFLPKPQRRVAQRQIVSLLLEHDANPSASDLEGWTPLHHAVDNRDFDLTGLLIEVNAKIDAQDKDGYTPLYFAREPRMILFLVEHGANVNAKNRDGETPLYRGEWRQRSAEEDLERKKKEQYSAATLANRRKELQTVQACVKTLRELGGISPCTQDELQSFFATLRKRQWDEVEDLIEANPYLVSLREFDTEERPLQLIIRYSYPLDAIERFIELGADPNTGLINAVGGGKIDVFELLLEHGADVNLPLKNGGTAIFFLPRSRYGPWQEIGQQLIQVGADVNVKDWQGATPLLHAIRWKQPHHAQFFLANGADVRARDTAGATALELALHRRSWPFNLALIEMLLNKGADPNERDHHRRTTLARMLDLYRVADAHHEEERQFREKMIKERGRYSIGCNVGRKYYLPAHAYLEVAALLKKYGGKHGSWPHDSNHNTSMKKFFDQK